MRVFITRKGKHSENWNCHLELCRRDGTVRKDQIVFTLHKYTSEPPYDDVELLHFHPECFMVWCLETFTSDIYKGGLDKASTDLLKSLPVPLIRVQ